MFMSDDEAMQMLEELAGEAVAKKAKKQEAAKKAKKQALKIEQNSTPDYHLSEHSMHSSDDSSSDKDA